MTKRLLMAFCMMPGIVPIHAIAQQSARFTPQSEFFFQAKDVAAQKLYAIAALNAQASLAQVQSGFQTTWPSQQIRAKYISAIAGLRDAMPYAVDTALALAPQVVETALRDRLSLAIAQYYFLHGELADAIPYYEASGIANLNNQEIADAKFELAYAYFNNRQFVAANKLFDIMKDVAGKYYSPGNYYYGLLAYNDGDYKAALKSFERINNETVYRPVVPYYIAEVYYFMGNREKALSEALRLIQVPEKSYYDDELHLLAAQSLFEAGRYGDALPYFEHYYEHTDKIRKEELYEMGYAYYRVNEWKSAIEKFKPLSATRDSLGQTAMYLLGDSYLKSGNKESARNAFGLCAAMSHNIGQREASLLLHSKLSYETGFSDDAMRSVRTLLADFPDGKFSSEARVLQSQLYLETSNYKGAYEALLQGESSLPEYWQVRQRAAYGYAMQELQRQHFNEANSLLSDALTHNSSPRYTEATLFWKGEVAYRLHHYDSATAFAEQFLAFNVPPDSGSPISAAATREHASLILGYAAMEAKDFKKAQKAFANAKASGNATTSANATLREADALFMQKDFAGASPFYAAAATGSGADAEYARLQSAIIAGILGDAVEKTRLLQTILSSNPPSIYSSEARYELGVVQLAANKYNEAISTLQPLTAGGASIEFAPKSLLKTGTAYQQLNMDDKALEAFRRIIREWNGAPERTDALAAIKSIYIERNQPDAYSKLLQDFNLPQATDEELDAAYYNAAEAQYADSKWSDAESGFKRYLQVYPSGRNAGKARYYLGNSFYNQKNFVAARRSYDTVLQSDWSIFSEEAAKKAAALAMADTGWAEAARYYRMLASRVTAPPVRLQAFIGLMRSSARSGDEQNASLYADSVLMFDGVAAAVSDESKLYIAHRSMYAGRIAEADSVFKTLVESGNGAVAAEARYHVAQSLLASGKLKEAEAAASRNIKLSTGYEYWVVKSYLLLGDIFIRQKDFFNARATFQSIAQHAGIPALKDEAQRKLDELKTTEGSKLSNE